MKISHDDETINIRVVRRKGLEQKHRDEANAEVSFSVFPSISLISHFQLKFIRSRGEDDNTAHLSGGERSITTVCFLMAIWNFIRTPIRCMDEFDVFMDTHHKQLATNILCQHAKDTPGTQVKSS